MKLKVTEKILDYDNKPVINLDQQGKPNGNLTWRQVVFTSLNSIGLDPQEKASEEDKMKAYAITKKAFDNVEPDFTVEEIAFILRNIKKVYNPLVCGRAEEVFGGKS